VISIVDPQARHTRKSPEARRDGYRAHLACEPGTGLITDEALTQAAGSDNSDPAIAQAFLANDLQANPTTDTETAASDTESTDAEAADAEAADAESTDAEASQPAPAGPTPTAEPTPAPTVQEQIVGDQGLAERVRSWFADSAYGAGDLRAAISAAGHRAVIKPKPLQVAVTGGFTVDDFTVDEPAGTITCPNQLVRPISGGRVATFGVTCRTCPLAGVSGFP
jgi:hypothetical protein